jgi:hypothetical protein
MLPDPPCVPCEERDRLNRVYLDATTKVFGAGKEVPNITSAKWRKRPQKARTACKAALADLKTSQERARLLAEPTQP